MAVENAHRAWLEGLTDEDLAFVKRFLLASGSLKAVAAEYGISYPTVRLRVDRLIAKIKLHDRQGDVSAFERVLRNAHIDGKIDHPTLTALLAAYREEVKPHADNE